MPKPLHIFKGALSGRYYATRSYKIHNAEKGLFEVTGQKEDVTEQIEAIISDRTAPAGNADVDELAWDILNSCVTVDYEADASATSPKRDYLKATALITAFLAKQANGNGGK